MRKADRDREAREKRDKTTGGSIQSGQPLPKLAAVVPSAKSMSIKSMQKALSCAGSSLKGGAQRVQAGGPAPPQGFSATSTPPNLSCKFDQLPSVITWLLQVIFLLTHTQPLLCSERHFYVRLLNRFLSLPTTSAPTILLLSTAVRTTIYQLFLMFKWKKLKRKPKRLLTS
jgi:hypothetical protein